MVAEGGMTVVEAGCGKGSPVDREMERGVPTAALPQHRLHVYKPLFYWPFERFYRLQIVYIVVYRSFTWSAESEELKNSEGAYR